MLASLVVRMNETIRINIEVRISHQATSPIATRTNMTIGEVNGTWLNQTIASPPGLLIAMEEITNANTSGSVIGTMNCCVSDSLSTAAPTAAKSDA